MKRVRVYICILALLNVAGANAQQQAKKHVLFLSSYTPSYPTFYEQLSGLSSVLHPDDVQLDIEFMDVKRFGHFDASIQHNLEYKLKNLPPYDLIISGDDAATQFVTQRRYGLFSDIPIVFFGVNDIDYGLSFDEDPQVTGVVEKASISDTLILIQDLFGSDAPLVVITDESPTGQVDLRRFYKETGQLGFDHYEVLSLTNNSFNEMLEKTSHLHAPSSILLLSCYVDRLGESQEFLTTLKQIYRNSSVPIFHMWRHSLGQGIFGGKLVSHFEQGKAAAAMANQILQGIPVSKTPVQGDSTNRYLFDFNEVQRFGFTLAEMPRSSQFINQPRPPDRTLLYLIIAALCCALLIAVTLTLMFRTQIRKSIEKRMLTANQELEREVISRTQALEIARLESENLLRLRNSILDNSLVGMVLIKNNKVEWINQQAESLFGYSAEEVLGNDAAFLQLNAAALTEFQSRSRQALKQGDTYQTEFSLNHRNGKTFWCIVSGKALDPEDLEKGVLYIMMDINSRKIMEDELKQLNTKLETQATTDYLTKLYNRRFVCERMEQEITRSNRYNTRFSVILLDIDHFKILNDRFGHDIGDLVLKELADLLKSSCRQVDTVARWGGEEFLILCPSTDPVDAAKLAELLRRRIELHAFSHAGMVTASFGVAGFLVKQSMASLIKMADNALYQAKEVRNTVIAPEPTHLHRA